MPTDTPHFDLPFRITGAAVAVLEQDTIEDVINCCKVILVTPVGFRSEVPAFGRPDLAFMQQPIGKDFIQSILISQDPRVDVVVDERPDAVDSLIDNITINVDLKAVAK